MSGECLACDSSGVIDDLQPISCEQCHGPSQEHLQRPARNNIQNPSRLSAEARDAVCEQCHLAGEARISSPTGISIAVYDRPRENLRVVSHVEQLALSECAGQSLGQLWCGSPPDIAGQGKANPTALLRSSVMMLEHLKELEAAKRLQQAIEYVYRVGDSLTPDVGGTATTEQFAG